MASVSFDVGYFHSSVDLTDFVGVKVNQLSSNEAESQGSVEQSITGRRRIITRPGLGNVLQFSLVLVPIIDVDWFRTHTNQELLFRGPKGRKYYGLIPSLSITEVGGPTDKVRGLSFTFIDISKTDEV